MYAAMQLDRRWRSTEFLRLSIDYYRILGAGAPLGDTWLQNVASWYFNFSPNNFVLIEKQERRCATASASFLWQLHIYIFAQWPAAPGLNGNSVWWR